VGKILDKSGRGNHATQATAASRPILRQDANGKYYLFFDGIDDSLATAAINFTSMTGYIAVAGVLLGSSGVISYIASADSEVVNRSPQFLRVESSNLAATITFVGASPFSDSGNTVAGSTPTVLTSKSSSTAIEVFVNKLSNGSSPITGTPNTESASLKIGISGRASSTFFNGHLYSLIVRGAQSSDSQIASAESYVNSKTGAY
jgi:hypothetical protein